jgi:hypothetical protein
MRERFRCRFLLVDRFVMGGPGRYAGGLGSGEPTPEGSPAALFLSQDAATLTSVPGFSLVYRSPPTIRSDGRTGDPSAALEELSDFFRVYRLDG